MVRKFLIASETSALKVSRKPFRSAALSQKAALQLPFSVTTPPVKMEHRSAFKIVPRKKQPPHFLVQRLLCLYQVISPSGKPAGACPP